MTDPKQFICSFLGIPETDFAEVQINSRMMVDMLQAYEVKLTFEKVWGENKVDAITDKTYSDLVVFGKAKLSTNELPVKMDVLKNNEMVASYNPETKDWTTKYPNLLNATNRD